MYEFLTAMIEWSRLKKYFLDNPIIEATLSRIRCPACGFIGTLDVITTSLAEPCPECSTSGVTREVWPTTPIPTTWLETMRDIMKRAEKLTSEKTETARKKLSELCGARLDAGSVESLVDKLHHEFSAKRLSIDEQVQFVSTCLKLKAESPEAYWTLVKAGEVTSDHRIVVLLAITLVEVFVDDFLTELLVTSGSSYEAARKCVRVCEGLRAKNALCRQMIKKNIWQAIIACGDRQDFLQDYNHLRRQRNNFVHGNPWAISREDARQGFSLAVESFSVFASLFNQHCRWEPDSVPNLRKHH